jgi:hypothetical protein
MLQAENCAGKVTEEEDEMMETTDDDATIRLIFRLIKYYRCVRLWQLFVVDLCKEGGEGEEWRGDDGLRGWWWQRMSWSRKGWLVIMEGENRVSLVSWIIRFVFQGFCKEEGNYNYGFIHN